MARSVKLAAGELNIEIPGASRGDEVGDLAKTVIVIRENAEQKARNEAEAKVHQDRRAAEQRSAEMIKLADTLKPRWEKSSKRCPPPRRGSKRRPAH